MGPSHGTFSQFLCSPTESWRTLDKLERWLTGGPNGDIGSTGFEESLGPWGDKSPASRLVSALEFSQQMRQLVAEIGREPLVKAAYAVALEEGWSEDELKKLDRWRERTLSNKNR